MKISISENLERKHKYYLCSICNKWVTENNRYNHRLLKYHQRLEGIDIKNKKTGPKVYVPE